jgi:YidC/Oxa1 family membrane protein insertase
LFVAVPVAAWVTTQFLHDLFPKRLPMFELIASVISFFYNLTTSYAAAIILLTVTIRLILFPLTAKQTRSMQNMARVQPQVKALQEEFANDRQKMNEEVMKFYRENKINPAAGCFPLLLQAPILIGLYRVIRGLSRTIETSGLMIRTAHPQYLPSSSKLFRSLVDAGGQMRSLGIDLGQSAQSISGTFANRLPYIVLVVLVGVTGYLQQIIMTKQQGPATTAQAAQMQKIMKYMPVMFAVISFNIQAAIVLYWIVGNVWMIGQSQVLRKMAPPPIIEPHSLSAGKDAPIAKSESIKPLPAGSAAKGAKGGNDAPRPGNTPRGSAVAAKSGAAKNDAAAKSAAQSKDTAAAKSSNKSNGGGSNHQAGKQNAKKATGKPGQTTRK